MTDSLRDELEAPSSSPMGRREFLGSTAGIAALGTAALVSGPAVAATAPPARPTTVPLEFVYEAIVTLGPMEEVGATPMGKRVRIPITGGTFAGPRLSGTILPEGMDWQLVRTDGFIAVEAAYLMREKDGTLIHIVNKGVVSRTYARTTPVFEVPFGPHQWLNDAAFTSVVEPMFDNKPPAVRITVYRLA